MKNIVKGLLVAGAVVGASTAVAGLEEVSPYVGGEYEWSSMRGGNTNLSIKGSSLKNVLPKSYSGANFFIGGRWCDFGVEAGYEFTGTKKKTLKENLPATVLPSLNFDSFKVSLNGWHIDFNGYLPLCDCWELIGSVGYGWMKPKVETTIGLMNNNNVSLGVISQKMHSKYKGMFRLGVGTQYMVTECVGLRGMLRWKNTEKLSVALNHGTNALKVNLKPFKDTLSLAAGVFVKF